MIERSVTVDVDVNGGNVTAFLRYAMDVLPSEKIT